MSVINLRDIRKHIYSYAKDRKYSNRTWLILIKVCKAWNNWFQEIPFIPISFQHTLAWVDLPPPRFMQFMSTVRKLYIPLNSYAILSNLSYFFPQVECFKLTLFVRSWSKQIDFYNTFLGLNFRGLRHFQLIMKQSEEEPWRIIPHDFFERHSKLQKLDIQLANAALYDLKVLTQLTKFKFVNNSIHLDRIQATSLTHIRLSNINEKFDLFTFTHLPHLKVLACRSEANRPCFFPNLEQLFMEGQESDLFLQQKSFIEAPKLSSITISFTIHIFIFATLSCQLKHCSITKSQPNFAKNSLWKPFCLTQYCTNLEPYITFLFDFYRFPLLQFLRISYHEPCLKQIYDGRTYYWPHLSTLLQTKKYCSCEMFLL